MSAAPSGPARTSPARTSTVEWLPGSDRLLGRCSCGVSAQAGDPIALWQWLLAHPDHPVAVAEPAAEPVRHTPPAHRVRHPAQAAGARTAIR